MRRFLGSVLAAVCVLGLTACSAPDLRGSVGFPHDYTVPPRALLEVALEETAGDTPQVIGKVQYRIQSRAPFQFVLKPESGVSRSDKYRLVARIFVEGALWYSNQPGQDIDSDAGKWPEVFKLELRKEDAAYAGDVQ